MSLLAQFAQALRSRALQTIDLTQTLSEDFPALELPPQFGQVKGFSVERISKYDDAGPDWYWNNFTCGEHTGKTVRAEAGSLVTYAVHPPICETLSTVRPSIGVFIPC